MARMEECLCMWDIWSVCPFFAEEWRKKADGAWTPYTVHSTTHQHSNYTTLKSNTTADDAINFHPQNFWQTGRELGRTSKAVLVVKQGQFC